MRGFASIGLIAPKKEVNVGGVLRAAGCYGVKTVVIQGIRYMKYSTDTQKAFRTIPTIFVDDIWASIPYGAEPVAVEICSRAKFLPGFVHPEQAFYIFGPENGSVPEELIGKCQRVVAVPTKFCMNLAAAVNVILYDRLAKRGADLDSGAIV